jgi:hypothetical protein
MSFPLAGVSSDIWCTATPSVTATNESCTDSGDHTTYTASVHTFWDWTQTFTVQNSPNGSTGWTTVTDYTFQWATGKLIFNTARVVSTNNFTRISTGNYFTATQLDGSHIWTLTIKQAVKDTTCFQAASAWQNNTPTIKSATAKVSTFRNDDRVSKELGNLLAVQLFVDKTNNIRWQFYALAVGSVPKIDANNVETQDLDFTSVRDIYLLTS